MNSIHVINKEIKVVQVVVLSMRPAVSFKFADLIVLHKDLKVYNLLTVLKHISRMISCVDLYSNSKLVSGRLDMLRKCNAILMSLKGHDSVDTEFTCNSYKCFRFPDFCSCNLRIGINSRGKIISW